MDKDWFRRQKKITDRTDADLAEAIGRDRAVISRIMNARQAMTVDQARLISEQLNAPLNEVLFRAGLLEDAEAFTKKPSPDLQDIIELPRAPDGHWTHEKSRSNLKFYRVISRQLRFFNILDNDLLACNQAAITQCKPGDLVIASIMDWQHNQPSLRVRKFEPPALIAAQHDGRFSVSILDHSTATILTRIVGITRDLAPQS